MTFEATRQTFEADPTFRRALSWNPDDGTLSGGERALAAVVHVLEEHFDRLDGPMQLDLAAALSAVADSTAAAEADARRILSRRAADAAEEEGLT
ncbi:hypothetical protein [Dietzia sp. 179-F 9C3 NHS]|uniref:hypothetical protein n=1 Tax=Dietzia sp. 179-F 9C3 NHS TaxID=3374295 RepID=UPI00387A7D96